MARVTTQKRREANETLRKATARRAKVGDANIVDSGVDVLFASRGSEVRALYDALHRQLRKFGAIIVEPKKTSLHLVSGTAFAGVHPRASGVLLNIKSVAPLNGSRVKKIERVSKNRFHNEVLLSSERDIDAELLGWLRDAYHLCARVR